MGYEQSATELESESKITYLTPEIRAIKAALPAEKYEEVEQVLISMKKHDLVKDVLSELKCLKFIREAKME